MNIIVLQLICYNQTGKVVFTSKKEKESTNILFACTVEVYSEQSRYFKPFVHYLTGYLNVLLHNCTMGMIHNDSSVYNMNHTSFE